MMRILFKADIAQLLVVEQSAHVLPWTEETFKTCFEAGYVGWGLEIDKKLVGFVIVSQRHEECHILNLCVSRRHQRKGYGHQLLSHVQHQAKQQGVSIIYLEVRRSNTRAIALYKKAHFMQVGERKDYYPGVLGNEDALIFAKSLRDAEHE